MSAPRGIHKAEAATEAPPVLREAWSPRASGEPPPSIIAERPIFLAEGHWRRRMMAAATAALGALLLVWLAAIVAGALGFGPLGPLPLLDVGRTDHPTGSPAAGPSRQPAVGAESMKATPGRLSPEARDRFSGAEGTSMAAQGHRSPAPAASGGAAGGGGTRSHPGSGVSATTPQTPATPNREGTRSSPAAAGGGTPATESPGSGTASNPQAVASHRPTVTPSGHEVPAAGAGGSAGGSPLPEGGVGKAETGMATSPG